MTYNDFLVSNFILVCPEEAVDHEFRNKWSNTFTNHINKKWCTVWTMGMSIGVAEDSEHIWKRKLHGITTRVDGCRKEWRLISVAFSLGLGTVLLPWLRSKIWGLQNLQHVKLTCSLTLELGDTQKYCIWRMPLLSDPMKPSSRTTLKIMQRFLLCKKMRVSISPPCILDKNQGQYTTSSGLLRVEGPYAKRAAGPSHSSWQELQEYIWARSQGAGSQVWNINLDKEKLVRKTSPMLQDLTPCQ